MVVRFCERLEQFFVAARGPFDREKGDACNIV
jgi:hypothetical protein